MRFDRSLREAWRETDDGWVCTLPPDWGQGRAVFGGLAAATAVALGYRNVDADWTLRTVNVQFPRPTAAGAVAGQYALLRAGKGTLFAEVRLLQAGVTVLVAQLVFVRPRASDVRVEAAPFRGTRSPDGIDEMPYWLGVTPEFTQHIAFRWAHGGFPYSGQPDAAFNGYCRLRVPFGDVEGMLGLLDAWPCPTLSTLKRPAMASSVMWTAHIIDVPTSTDGWFGFEYDTVVGQHGMHTAVGRLFAPDGRLVGWTEQLVAVFA